MGKKNAIYAQSGGVTSVINTCAYGVIKAAMASDFIGHIYAGLNGINGVIEEKLIDLSKESPEAIEGLKFMPGGAFGSCRRKLRDLEKDKALFQRILDVCKAHDVEYFFYNGGNDSMDTVKKLSDFAKQNGSSLKVMGVPKTVDNDLPITDASPGFASAAKYLVVSMIEASRDLESMARDSTKVFVLEAMGRHAGWMAAATALAQRDEKDGPHIILLPEVKLDRAKFMAKVKETVDKIGYCAVTVSEGVKNPDGTFLAESGTKDAFGHAQLGGAGQTVQDMIKQDLGLKTHGAIPDYCQRSARHMSSKVDVEQAEACGRKAVELAGQGLNGHMVTIIRTQDAPYKWHLESTDAGNIANTEKVIPKEFIREDGFHMTEAFRKYCQPLIEGESFPEFKNGMPVYHRLKKELVKAKLPPFESKK
ncbi:MAG: 6-phosphofructokinase [Deltaproteobacteria bacterium]|nr:6-phosphofructokinase [Deltaproteobacteria bacterium]